MTPARIEERKAFLVAGTVATYQMPNIEGIPEQWRKFDSLIGKIPGQVGSTSYGICFNMNGSGKMDYMCGVEIAGGPPDELSVLQIDAQRYAIFEHRAHISKIKSTWMAIFEEWAPNANETIAPKPQIEAYGSDFTPETGPVEIWIPVAAK